LKTMEKEMKFASANNIWDMVKFCNENRIQHEDIVVLFEFQNGPQTGYTLVYYGRKQV
jgi:hypothetical protein